MKSALKQGAFYDFFSAMVSVTECRADDCLDGTLSLGVRSINSLGDRFCTYIAF